MWYATNPTPNACARLQSRILTGYGRFRALSLDPEVLANASPKLLYRTGLRYAFHCRLAQDNDQRANI